MKRSILIFTMVFTGIQGVLLAQDEGVRQTAVPTGLLSLDECIRIALENQPAIGASQGAILSAESEYTQVLSSRFPQLQFEAGAYITNTPLQSSNVIASTPIVDPQQGTKFIPSTRLTMRQPIYDFGRTERALESKAKLIKVAEMSLQSTEDDVILNVHQAYYNYGLAKQVVQINEERVAQSTKRLERAKGFFEVGKLPESDVSKAELDVANAELQLIDARGKLRLAKVTLNGSMGIIEAGENLAEYQTTDELQFVPFEMTLSESIESTLTTRKEVKAADLRIQASRSALSAAKSQYFPIITASAGVGPYLIQKDPSDPLSRDQFKMGYNIGLNFAWPIFQGLTVRAEIFEAQGAIRIATSQANVLRQQVLQEVQERYFSVKVAEERYKASEKLVDQSQKNLALAAGRFETGLGAAIEFSDANLALANAKIDRTTALYNFEIERSKFLYSIGKIRGK